MKDKNTIHNQSTMAGCIHIESSQTYIIKNGLISKETVYIFDYFKNDKQHEYL